MRYLLTLTAILILAAACGGDGPETVEGLVVIERLDLEDEDLELADLYESSISNPYPDVVATVNGEAVTGEELVFRQVSLELSRRDALEADAALQSMLLSDVEAVDPLEALIEDQLLNQSIVRLGLWPSREEAVEYTRHWEDLTKHPQGTVEPGSEESSRELFRLQGFDWDDWASNEQLVESYRESLGIVALRAQECSGHPTPTAVGFLTGSFGYDCSAFLAEERVNADIEYFVTWAD